LRKVFIDIFIYHFAKYPVICYISVLYDLKRNLLKKHAEACEASQAIKAYYNREDKKLQAWRQSSSSSKRQFPGAICKINEPKTALLIFKNGKIICTGAKNVNDIRRAIDKAIKVIKSHTL
jgi:TATA binding protein of transcription factor TFIID